MIEAKNRWDKLLEWCNSVLGKVEIVADSSKTHGGHESTTCRLSTPSGYGYLKIHETRSHWQQEVHAYEKWAGVFGRFAPDLIAVHEETPLALIVSELPGQVLEKVQLSRSQEQKAWQTAGSLLAALHQLAVGSCFGPCLRSGVCSEPFPQTAEAYVSEKFSRQIDQARQRNIISRSELSTLYAAAELIPAFAGEKPLPCHRDYCAANWLVTPDGAFSGIIDFEFAHWDVRAADFSRDPHWSWMQRPDLIEAFFDGYSLPPPDAQQLLVARAEYALSAIIWGHENQFWGFEREGHDSLDHIAGLLKKI